MRICMQGLSVCPQTSSHDRASVLSAEDLDGLIDAALFLACVVLHMCDNNLREARRWLRAWEQRVSGQIRVQFLTRQQVAVSSVSWLFIPAVSDWVVLNGVVESLTSATVAEVAEMVSAVRNVLPVLAPPTPVQGATPVPARMVVSPIMFSSPESSPAVGRMVAQRVMVPEPVFVHGVDTPFSPALAPLAYPEPGTPSPRALLAPVELADFDELMG